MKIAELQAKQPQLLDGFFQILRAGKLAHAYLFTGRFGALEMALFLAQSQFCETPKDCLPCQECRSCRLIEADAFTDVRRLEASNNLIKTDTVRTALQDLAQSGFESDRQVLIIDGADKLHPNASNSLLKFIEEPHSQLKIFLLADQEMGVLPTIKSRCQLFHFSKNKVLLQAQLEQEGLLKSQAQLLSELCGSKEEALGLTKGSHFSELVTVCDRWVKAYLAVSSQAYLLTAGLAVLVSDKTEQSLVFDLLTHLMAQALPQKKAQKGLSQLLSARQMWQANVSFQNALEYMILE